MSDDHRRHISASKARSSAVELAELLGVVSLATDLGMGQPMEHMLRQLFANRCLYTRAA
jgi:hypothetical protein